MKVLSVAILVIIVATCTEGCMTTVNVRCKNQDFSEIKVDLNQEDVVKILNFYENNRDNHIELENFVREKFHVPEVTRSGHCKDYNYGEIQDLAATIFLNKLSEFTQKARTLSHSQAYNRMEMTLNFDNVFRLHYQEPPSMEGGLGD
jgi:hypothetical protein